MSIQWIHKGLQRPGRSRAGLARALRLNPSQVTRLLAGSRRLKVDEVERIARYLGVGPDQADYTERLRPLGVPIVDYVQAGHWGEVNEPFPQGDDYDVVHPNEPVGERAFALIVKGVSMLSEFREPDRIIVDPDVQPIPGDFVVAKLDGEEQATFKKYRPRGLDRRNKPVIELIPLNEDWPTLTIDSNHPGRVIGVVVEHHRRLK